MRGVSAGDRSLYLGPGCRIVALVDAVNVNFILGFVELIDQLLNRIGRPQPTRIPRSFGKEDKFVSYKASPEVVRDPEEVEKERGLAATFDVEFRTRSYSTWQGLLYGEGYDGMPFSSELELVNKMLGSQA